MLPIKKRIIPIKNSLYSDVFYFSKKHQNHFTLTPTFMTKKCYPIPINIIYKQIKPIVTMNIHSTHHAQYLIICTHLNISDVNTSYNNPYIKVSYFEELLILA